MMKKLFAGVGLAAAGAALASALIAGAQTTQTGQTATPGTAPVQQQQMVLQVGRDGRALLRGTIASAASGVLTVNSWGGAWTVNVSSATQVLPAVSGNDVTQFKAGDYVGVQGTVSQSANWTITAAIVHDWTYRQAVDQQRRQNVQSARETIQGSTPRNFEGTASNVSGSSFTLAGANGASFTVNVASGAEVVNRNWLNISVASIQSGDNVRVWGLNASGTIAAQIVRDVSIPAATSAPVPPSPQPQPTSTNR